MIGRFSDGSAGRALRSADLSARCTAAAAALADYEQQDAAFVEALGRRDMPDYITWCIRLAAELRSVLSAINTEGPGQCQPK